ncbi:MAG: Gfo/Idh/MocA family oxidoreductase [Clostridia bacterium]|nr:Gfo/Idh/MocA family oxidoreductase [Clostridia bacterium]
MLNIGIIGAGAISVNHLEGYAKLDECRVVAIADTNINLAKERAEKYGVGEVYSDYKELLADSKIDAVSISTPTFTHTDIVIDALKSGKNVLCEKPPALNSDDVRKCIKTAEENKKLLMYGFVCRFRNHSQYAKKYISDGKMGKFVCAQANRVTRCSDFSGWLSDKEKAGGFLLDGGIHELDLALYLMGYPKPVTVLGFTSNINSDLPSKVQSGIGRYKSMDTVSYKRTIESFAGASVLLDNGAYINIKTGSSLLSVETLVGIEIIGESAGFIMQPFVKGNELKILELTEDNYFNEATPLVDENNPFDAEIKHFVDCCLNKTECICKPYEAVTLLEIINAVYQSAETGKAVEFN